MLKLSLSVKLAIAAGLSGDDALSLLLSKTPVTFLASVEAKGLKPLVSH